MLKGVHLLLLHCLAFGCVIDVDYSIGFHIIILINRLILSLHRGHHKIFIETVQFGN